MNEILFQKYEMIFQINDSVNTEDLIILCKKNMRTFDLQTHDQQG